MKTTIEITDHLLEEAKRLGGRERTTLRALVEEGLRKVIAERSEAPASFTLRKASYKGRGVRNGVAEGDWESIRDLIYEGRGA